MRNDHQGMPEMIDASERDGKYFGVVAVVLEGDALAFEFGIDAEGYRALRKALEVRPFETSDPSPYRHFFVPGAHRFGADSDRGEFSIRVEQGRKGRQFRVTGPRSLIANLTWFAELKFANGARHLRQVALRAMV